MQVLYITQEKERRERMMKYKNWLKLFALIYVVLAGIDRAVGAESMSMALAGVTFAVLAVAEELNHE
jgi:uncharacterized membrane protein